jgi:Ca2+-binding EF-hand superfamily protein
MDFRRGLLERRSGYAKFSHRTMDFLQKLLLIHLKVAEGLEQLRRRLYRKREKYVLDKVFRDLDPSKKGYLSSHDLGSILAYSRKLKLVPQDSELLLALLDTNGDKKVDAQEFIAQLMPQLF